MCRLMATSIVTCEGIFTYVLLSALVGFVFAQSGETAGVPLPERCNEKRGDRTTTITCPESDIRVHRFFFNPTKHCKRFGVCQSKATLLDNHGSSDINYFQNLADCEQACTDVVVCPREPLTIANGMAGMEDEEGVWSELQSNQRLGLGALVTFRCDQGYGLPEGEWNRTCEKNGSWSGTTPSCNVLCPKPEHPGYTVSQLSNYYNIGDMIQVNCMDGHEGSSRWTCQQDGSWEGVLPNCSRGCSPPRVDNSPHPAIQTDGTTIRYTYTCSDGYTLLNNISHNSSLTNNTHTVTCIDGEIQGEIPVCTRIQIRSPAGPVSAREDGTFYYEMERSSDNIDVVFTCGLEGVEGVDQPYPAQWVLPRKPNTGEPPPDVDYDGDRLIFLTVLRVQTETYFCNICNVMASVFINVTEPRGQRNRPTVRLLTPGKQKVEEGTMKTLRTFITGSIPLDVVWQKDNSNITGNDQYQLLNVPSVDSVLSTLVISGFQASNAGTYQIVANNSGGWTVSSENAMLMLQDGNTQERRQTDSEYSAFCNEGIEEAVVLSGTVRGISSDYKSFTLKLNEILRNSSNQSLRTRRRIKVQLFTDDREKLALLHRKSNIIISGLPAYSETHGQEDLYMIFDTPIVKYSTEAATEIRRLNC